MDHDDDCENNGLDGGGENLDNEEEFVQDDDNSEYEYPESDDEEEEGGDNDEDREGSEGSREGEREGDIASSSSTSHHEMKVGSSSMDDEHDPITTTTHNSSNKKARSSGVGIQDKIILCDVQGIRSLHYFKLIDEIAKLFFISKDESLALLFHFKWNKEKLIESYFDQAEKVRANVGIDLYRPMMNVVDHHSSSSCSTTTADPKATLKCCEICYDDITPDNSIALGCDHFFCTDCFRSYLQTQVSNGPPSCLTTRCPHFKCTQLVPHSYFRHLLTPPATDSPASTEGTSTSDESNTPASSLLEKYEAYCVRNFIENSRTMNFCRAAHCELIAVATNGAHVDEVVHCSCGHQYCFKCGEEPHQPCNCRQVASWNEKCSNESETTNWIMANTKKCPKCSVRIEKNQGCNHMTCRHCNHHFCWLCFADWNKHGYNYKCNALEMDKGAAAVNAKRDLDRYIHYYKRWNDHRLSLTFALKQVKKIHDQLLLTSNEDYSTTLYGSQAAASGMTIGQWMFHSSIARQQLLRAAELIVECRRVLQNTYVLGYFIKDDSAEKQLFEFSQSMLEHHTEMLHEVTETYGGLREGENPPEMDSGKVINLTMVTQKFLNSLMESMRGGVLMNTST